jgi:ABC-2 type transport system permease protein
MSLTHGATSSTGSIYDLGYRRYDGPRLGRRAAVRALFGHSIRTLFGIGRGGRAKIAPFGLLALGTIPAIIAIGVAAIGRQAGADADLAQASPIRYDTYIPYVAQIIMLFVAAQAPELLGRDQRHNVLSLYFSRALRRTDYAIARAAGFFVAVLVFVVIPQAIIFGGLVLAAPDLPAAIVEEAGSIPPIVAEALVVAFVLGGLALAVAALVPRRAYATATIIGVFAVPPIVVQVSRRGLDEELAQNLRLLSPADIVTGSNRWLFSGPGTSVNGVDGQFYVLAAVIVAVVALAVLVRRYVRIAA